MLVREGGRRPHEWRRSPVSPIVGSEVRHRRPHSRNRFFDFQSRRLVFSNKSKRTADSSPEKRAYRRHYRPSCPVITCSCKQADQCTDDNDAEEDERSHVCNVLPHSVLAPSLSASPAASTSCSEKVFATRETKTAPRPYAGGPGSFRRPAPVPPLERASGAVVLHRSAPQRPKKTRSHPGIKTGVGMKHGPKRNTVHIRKNGIG